MLTCKPFTLNSCFSQTKCDQMWRNVCKPPQILSDWSLLHLCTLPRHRMLQMLQMWGGCNPSVGQDHRNSGFPTKSGVRRIQRNFLATNLIGYGIGPNEKSLEHFVAGVNVLITPFVFAFDFVFVFIRMRWAGERGSSGSDPSASELHGSAASAYTQTFSYNIFIFIAFYFNIYIFIREESTYTVHLFTFIWENIDK